MAHLAELSGQLGRRFVFALDDQLRRFEGIYAYSQDPRCVVRISPCVSRKECTLADGTVVHRGDPLIELHWWNEHIARLAASGSSLQWGLQFYRHVYHSVLALGRYVEAEPELREVVALHGETTFPDETSFQHHANAFRRMGFELVALPPPTSPGGQVMHALRRFHVWALTWASNPSSLRHKGPCAVVRCDLWISRRSLLERCAVSEPGIPLSLDGQKGHAREPAYRGSVLPPPVPGRRLSGLNAPVRARAENSDPWALLRARMRGDYTSWKR